MRKSALFAAATIALCGIASTTVIAPARAQEAKIVNHQPNITVNGIGEVTVTPDIARITVGVLTEGKESTGAAQENATRTDAVIKAIKALGIADKDIQTADYSISPQYDYNKQPALLLQYQVTNSVRITVRKIGDAGKVLDVALKAGANIANNIQLDLSDPQAAQDAALAKAVADATRKARVIAKAANIPQIGLIEVTEGEAAPPPRPIFMAKADSTMAATPIASGEQKITVSITARFSIINATSFLP